MHPAAKTPGKPILIQCATPLEFRALQAAFDISQIEKQGRRQFFPVATEAHSVVLRGGVGQSRAAISAEFAIVKWAPRLFIDFGAAGALAPGLQTGDIVLAQNIGEASLYPRFSDSTGAARVLRGDLISLSHEVSSMQERRALHESTNAIAVSWESFAIGQVCENHRIPYLSIRVITDTGENALHLEYEKNARKVLAPAAALVRQWIESSSGFE